MVPQKSILAICVLIVLIPLISIGSSAAFHTIVFLGVNALIATDLISIGYCLPTRLLRQRLPPARSTRAVPASLLVMLL